MRKTDIEAWALHVIDRVVAGQAVEDARVELKSAWPEDPRRAARRIAGHANAASGEPILWLIGVDEGTNSVPGVDDANFDDWWPRASAGFSELTPYVDHVNVPYQDRTISALLFETDRAPFVVTNPDGGAVAREVPWREGTHIRSAKRADLLRLLTPIVNRPSIDVAAFKVSAESGDGPRQERNLNWSFVGTCFLVQPQGQQSVLSAHHTTIEFAVGDGDVEPVLIRSMLFELLAPMHQGASDFASAVGPVRFSVRGNAQVPYIGDPPALPLRVRVEFAIPNQAQAVIVSLSLPVRTMPGVNGRHWQIANLARTSPPGD